jgi:hypothetical protein
MPESVRLSWVDEADLRAYFGSYRPSAPGERSNLSALTMRLAGGRPAHSTERPTRDTPWTEIVDCAHEHGAVNFDGEDAMIAYLDARRRFRRVSRALARIPTGDQAVLDAYYGTESPEHVLGPLAGVAILTETALRRNRSRAARGMHEPIEATVRWLAAATAPENRATLDEVRREAAEMLATAKQRYARAQHPTNWNHG